jgi:hypothetical protein
VDLGGAAQEWQTHGFVILPGLVPAAELEPALAELPAMYPTAEGLSGDASYSGTSRKVVAAASSATMRSIVVSP